MKMTILRELWIWMKDAVWFLRISRPGVRVPSIAPENAVKSKDFMAFLFCKPWLHGFCTVFARSVFSISDYVGRCIALQSVPFFASGEQCQAEFCLHFRVGILEQFQESRHGDGGFACCGIYAENTLKRGHPDRWPLFCCRELSGCGSG